ncbi:diguanylate cyclase (GGDEF)-like protein [Hoeflea marina]|uniref:diguanylate cyclase n=1 Tax=Hoeflea marina TaxID=274592 RepID=A0A317PLH1_9HYPH|nr:diguanylate cyclase [Hoeflea marina]PWV99876.1 diguanylate cyclase (GGDEF)-like protein [Hoeflea marina]
MDSTYILSAFNPVLALVFAVIFLLIWRRQRDATHVLNWAIGYGAASVGFGFEYFHFFFPALELWMGINIFIPVSALFAARGLCLRHSGRSPDGLLVAILALTNVVGWWFVFGAPNVLARGLTVSTGISALMLVATYAIAKNRQRDRIDIAVSIAAVSIAVMLMARLVGSLMMDGPPVADTREADSFWIISLKVVGLYSWMAFAILFVLRIAADLVSELSLQSITDPLSGVLNRRGFFAAAETMIAGATQSLPVSMLILDIDHFKKVNDDYGHQTGDEVIRRVAHVMDTSAPDTAVVGRLGGEEFAIFLPNTRAEAACGFAESLRALLRMQAHPGIPASHPVTVSIGVTEGHGESLDQMFQLADTALYRAKHGGRDQVQLDRGTEAEPDATARLDLIPGLPG